MTGNARLVFAAGLASAIGGAVGSDATLWARVRGGRPSHERDVTQQAPAAETAPLAAERGTPAAPAVDMGALRADIRAIVRDEVASAVHRTSAECATKTEAHAPAAPPVAPPAAPAVLGQLAPATSDLHIKMDMRGRPF